MHGGPPNDNLSGEHHQPPDNVSSGRIEVFAEARKDFVLLGEHTTAEVANEGALAISSVRGSSTIGVRCPLGTSLMVGSGSGRISVSGRVGDIRTG